MTGPLPVQNGFVVVQTEATAKKCTKMCAVIYWFCYRSAIRSDHKHRYRKNSFLDSRFRATVFETCHVFKFQYRNIKLDWIFGSEVKPWIRSNNFGSLARTLDLRNTNIGSIWKKLWSRGKQLCRIMKSTLVVQKLWIQNINFYLITRFLLSLEWYFRIIQTHTEVTPDLSPLFHDANHHRYKALGWRLKNELTQIAKRFLAERNTCAPFL